MPTGKRGRREGRSREGGGNERQAVGKGEGGEEGEGGKGGVGGEEKQPLSKVPKLHGAS